MQWQCVGIVCYTLSCLCAHIHLSQPENLVFFYLRCDENRKDEKSLIVILRWDLDKIGARTKS